MPEDTDAPNTASGHALTKKFVIEEIRDSDTWQDSDGVTFSVIPTYVIQEGANITDHFKNPRFRLNKLKQKFNVNYSTYPRSEAPILGIPNNESGRFDGKQVIVIDDQLNVGIPFHEYFHALMQAVRRGNAKLWTELKDEINTSENGKRVKDYILTEYPNHRKNLEISGVITENAFDEMITTLMEAHIVRRLNHENWFGVLRSFIRETGNKLDAYLLKDIPIENLSGLTISNLTDIILFGEGKIDIKKYME